MSDGSGCESRDHPAIVCWEVGAVAVHDGAAYIRWFWICQIGGVGCVIVV